MSKRVILNHPPSSILDTRSTVDNVISGIVLLWPGLLRIRVFPIHSTVRFSLAAIPIINRPLASGLCIPHSKFVCIEVTSSCYSSLYFSYSVRQSFQFPLELSCLARSSSWHKWYVFLQSTQNRCFFKRVTSNFW